MHRLRLDIAKALLLVTLALPALSGRVEALTYHPLEVGFQWEYYSTLDGYQTMTITGERDILGIVTRVRRQEEQIQVFENFWTDDTEGNLYLHGAVNLTDGFEVAYFPPIQMVDAPLYLGKAWVTENIGLYDLDGTPWDVEIDYPLRVYTEGIVTVPAGDFYAYGVGYDVGPIVIESESGQLFDIFGRRIEETEEDRIDNATEWYSVDVGLVQHTYLADEELGFKLLSYEFPVAISATTWGGLRLLFR